MICSRSKAKKLSEFTNFPGNKFLCGVRKNICTTPFVDAQELHSWITLKANVCIFLYISLKKFRFRGIVKFYLVGVGWGKLNNFLMAAGCLGLAKCFINFILIEIFETQLFLSISVLLFIVLKRCNFPGNLDFKSKIAAASLIRTHFLSK